MNFNEYSATKIMEMARSDAFGEGEPLFYNRLADGGSYYFLGETHPFRECGYAATQWHPDTDRNQLWLVLEALPADESLWVMIQGTGSDRPDYSAEVLGFCCIHEMALKEPALALEAICKAHQAQEDK